MRFLPAGAARRLPEPEALALHVQGEVLEACPDGVLWWVRERCLVVADLHLEKGAAFARRNQLLPPFDTAATLDRLEAAMDRLQPRWLLALGDSFHDRHGLSAMDPADRNRLTALTERCPWVWVTGNHDPLPPDLAVETVEEWRQGNLTFRHEAIPQRGDGSGGEVSGHFHPCATVSTRGGRLRARCFVSDGHKLILPAFGAYTGGLNLRDPAIARLMHPGYSAVLIGHGRPVCLPAERLGG